MYSMLIDNKFVNSFVVYFLETKRNNSTRTMLSDDLENWMKNLDLQLTTLPIIYLAIPGSHDSMSYGIDSHSKPAPDAEREIVQLYKILPCVVRRWARTQSLSITEQLSIGIRYFDLRIARHSFYCDYYFVHGLYCENVEHPFNEMRNFLKSHPKEFVILDFQHFYNFNVDDHNALCKTILYYFGDVIFEKRESLLMCNLNIARQMKKQVLIIYREFLPDSTIFWNSHEWPTPWPNKVNIKSLKQYLTDSLHERKPVSKLILRILF